MLLECVATSSPQALGAAKSLKERLRQMSEAQADERVCKTQESAPKLQKTQSHKNVVSYTKAESEDCENSGAKEVTPESVAESGKRTWGSSEFQRQHGATEGHQK